ncbi:MAG: hypothetical protein Q9218_005239 [Villophora microphyllina]
MIHCPVVRPNRQLAEEMVHYLKLNRCEVHLAPEFPHHVDRRVDKMTPPAKAVQDRIEDVDWVVVDTDEDFVMVPGKFNATDKQDARADSRRYLNQKDAKLGDMLMEAREAASSIAKQSAAGKPIDVTIDEILAVIGGEGITPQDLYERFHGRMTKEQWAASRKFKWYFNPKLGRYMHVDTKG